MRVHLLTGEYPPASGGIACFTAAVAEGLAARGIDVHVWVPVTERTVVANPGEPIVVHTLPDGFGAGSRRALGRAWSMGDVVALQYAPNALGARGANVAFCRWLWRQSRHGCDVRVMFHEPFFYFGWQSPGRNALAAVHRIMAMLLLRAARVAYLSTPAWETLLRPYAPRDIRFAWVPVPSAVPVVEDRAAVDRVRRSLQAPLIVGHFSSYAADVRQPLSGAVRDILAAHPAAAVFCIGRGSAEFAQSLGSDRVHASGELALRDLSLAIQACDLMVQPYADGVTTRRTSLTTLLAHGASVVTSSGPHTEGLWTSDGEVLATAPAGDRRALAAEVARVADAPFERRDRADRARAFYASHFSVDRAVEALLNKGTRPVPVIVGAHVHASGAADAARQESFARQLRACQVAELVNVQFVRPDLQQRIADVETLDVLVQDSVSITGRDGPPKPVVSEIFDALADRAVMRRVRYFMYVNADVEVRREAILEIVDGARDAYVFARTECEAGQPWRLLRNGIDAFVFDARWWKCNRNRFRAYLLGEPTWDNVYAAIALSHSDGALIANVGLLCHETHEIAWRHSPFAEYQRLLAALDARYFTKWCEYYSRIRNLDEGAFGTAGPRAADQTFGAQETFRQQLVQSARAAKAYARYAFRSDRSSL
jgi:glycosyltransferase involved in cell wall biosynthesis